jgi:serine-type D-Ala-D-Ala carboxypeptidase (penicillin-binding protein 5/6)
MLRRLPSSFARFRPPRPSNINPRTPHLAGIVLTCCLLIGLVGTLVLTFTVALSASSEKSNGSGSSSATIVAPDNSQPEIATTPEPTEEPVEEAAVNESDETGDAEPTTPPVSSAAEITAQSAFVLDVKSGKALTAVNADERRPMASLTKMVTALVVTKALNDELISLDDSVLIEETDVVDPMIYSHMGLVAGDTVSVEQLLEGMLIPSGNDAAKALARYVGERLPGAEDEGPRAAFVTAMNEVVTDLGLEDTAFESPDGDDDEGNYSTAHDLAYIGRAVMKSKLLAQIVGVPKMTVTSTGLEQRQYELFNTNHLLGTSGVDGIKTGTTVGAGACLVVSSALDNGQKVIVVVLGSDPDPIDQSGDPVDWPRFADARALFAKIADGS